MTIQDIIASIAQLGAGGVLAILIVKMVLDYLRKRGGDVAGHCEICLNGWQETRQQVSDLHDWHSREDGDGVRLIYRSRQADRAMERIADAMDRQSALLEKISGRVDELGR